MVLLSKFNCIRVLIEIHINSVVIPRCKSIHDDKIVCESSNMQGAAKCYLATCSYGNSLHWNMAVCTYAVCMRPAAQLTGAVSCNCDVS